MRLFRRFILCVVVGVTAFGAAGWMLRPRASWSTTLEAGRIAFAIYPCASPDHGAPMWVCVYIGWFDCAVFAIDPHTGERLNEVRVAGGDLINRPKATLDGRLMVRTVTVADGEDGPSRRVDSTEFKLFNARE